MLCHKCYEHIHISRSECPNCGAEYKDHPSIEEHFDCIKHYDINNGDYLECDALIPLRTIAGLERRNRMASIIEYLYREYAKNEVLLKRYKLHDERWRELMNRNFYLRTRIIAHYNIMSGIYAKQHTDQSLLVRDRLKWRR